jgi:hypothetical protein
MLVTHKSSISIKVILPIPDRANASATQEPTPPMPIIQKWLFLKIVNAFEP